MSDDEKKETPSPETNFLPPLNMILTFFDRKFRKRDSNEETSEEQKEKNVEKLIEKLSEKEEK